MLKYRIANAKIKYYVLTSFLIFSLVWSLATPYMALAAFSYTCMIFGIFFVQDRKMHRAVMTSVIGMDITLVLFLEVTRQAIKTTMGNSLNLFQIGHIFFSALAIVLYLATAYFGMQAYAKHTSGDAHKKLGWCAFAARTIGFVLMFSLLEKINK